LRTPVFIRLPGGIAGDNINGIETGDGLASLQEVGHDVDLDQLLGSVRV
jgi:hypothetical protein